MPQLNDSEPVLRGVTSITTVWPTGNSRWMPRSGKMTSRPQFWASGLKNASFRGIPALAGMSEGSKPEALTFTRIAPGGTYADTAVLPPASTRKTKGTAVTFFSRCTWTHILYRPGRRNPVAVRIEAGLGAEH